MQVGNSASELLCRLGAHMDNNLPALERALDTLELLGAYPGGLSAADIGEHTGIPRATLYRILRLLRQREFLAGAPEAATRLVLGPALARLAALVPGERELRARVQPHVDALCAQLGETVKFVVREGFEAVTIAVAHPPGDLCIASRVGARRPLHVGAAQRLILAHAPDEVQQALFAGGLPSRASRTITSIRTLREDLALARRRGWASGHSEGAEGVGAGAAVVTDGAGQVPGVLVTVFIHGGKSSEQRREIMQRTIEAAGRLSAALGSRQAG
ncbi:MAG: hypothetical protein ABT05_01745 [Lautropia sp. SCN 66-9]|nr:MAG: hypothetical protein ABT05_01745 [Lautropia sp. SCN 66-9]